MSDSEPEVGDDGVDDSGRNVTQRQMDEAGVEDKPVDEEWEEEASA